MTALLLSPAARAVGAALAGFLLCAGIYAAGYRSASQACRAADLARELKSARFDIEAARDAAEHADRLTMSAEARAMELQRKVDSYAKELPAVAACVLSDDDAKRLRDIFARGR